jgi:hypothetical protein
MFEIKVTGFNEMYILYYVPSILYGEPFLTEVMKFSLALYKVRIILDRYEQK